MTPAGGATAHGNRERSNPAMSGGVWVWRGFRLQPEGCVTETLRAKAEEGSTRTSSFHYRSRDDGPAGAMAALTAEQLAAVTPAFSDTEFTAAVGRLSAAAQVTAFALQAPLPGAEYDSCGSTRSDTDSGRDLTISADALNIAAIIGDVACNSIVVILGEGSNLPACIIAGVLHEAVQAVNFERDLRNYCDGVINGNEIRGILNNSTVIGSNLASHDADIKAALAQHDAEIKALLAIVQQSVDEANQRLKVSEALERQALKLLLTPEGLRSVDPAVMTCTGDHCPKLVICPGPDVCDRRSIQPTPPAAAIRFLFAVGQTAFASD
jgi:hypothetical protein